MKPFSQMDLFILFDDGEYNRPIEEPATLLLHELQQFVFESQSSGNNQHQCTSDLSGKITPLPGTRTSAAVSHFFSMNTAARSEGGFWTCFPKKTAMSRLVLDKCGKHV